MRPEAVVHGSEHDTLAEAMQRRQHHVAGVQGMDEVGREGVLLFDGVGWRQTHQGVTGSATSVLLLELVPLRQVGCSCQHAEVQLLRLLHPRPRRFRLARPEMGVQIVAAGVLDVGLHHGQSQGRHPTDATAAVTRDVLRQL